MDTELEHRKFYAVLQNRMVAAYRRAATMEMEPDTHTIAARRAAWDKVSKIEAQLRTQRDLPI